MLDGTTIGDVVAKAEGQCEWTIPDFSKLPIRTRAYFHSPDFDAVGERWFLRVYPNGASGITRTRMTLLRRSPCSWKSVRCTVGVKRADDHSEERIGTEDCGVILNPFFTFSRTRRELKEEGSWLPGGQLTVTCHIEESHYPQERRVVIRNYLAASSGNED